MALVLDAIALALSLAVFGYVVVIVRREALKRPSGPVLRPGETVIVITNGAEPQSIRGVVVNDERQRGGGLELALAELLTPNGGALELEGGAWVPGPSVGFVQLVPSVPKAPSSTPALVQSPRG